MREFARVGLGDAGIREKQAWSDWDALREHTENGLNNLPQFVLPASLNVTGFMESIDGSTVYQITMGHAGATVLIERRFSMFWELHEDLARDEFKLGLHLPDLKTLLVKKWFVTAKVKNQRVRMLNQYLQDLLKQLKTTRLVRGGMPHSLQRFLGIREEQLHSTKSETICLHFEEPAAKNLIQVHPGDNGYVSIALRKNFVVCTLSPTSPLHAAAQRA